jgi:hypothetical protein
MVNGYLEDLEHIKATASMAGVSAGISWFLGIVFAVLGVIGDAANVKLGLDSTSWFLLAIVVSLISVSLWIGWAVALYLKSIEAKSEKTA